jgi:hypothetical protein
VYDPSTYHILKAGVATSLCLLEKVFPPTLFDLMMHLVLHLMDELDICGPVHFRWMYPIERIMKDLKGYVCNMHKPKGRMAKGHIFDEVLGLCTEYMHNFEATNRHVWDANEEEGVVGEVLEGQPKP